MSIFTNKLRNLSIICDSYSESNYSSAHSMRNGAVTKYSQSFSGNGSILNSNKFYLKKDGSPTGNAVAKIYAHTGTFGTDGTPTSVALATSENFDVSTLITSMALTTFTFTGAEKITLTNGTHYFVVIEYNGGDTDNRIYVGADWTSPSHSGNMAYYLSSWTSDVEDLIFYIYGESIFTNKSKNSTSLTNKTKNSTSLTNKTKISTSLTNKAKVSTTFTNKS